MTPEWLREEILDHFDRGTRIERITALVGCDRRTVVQVAHGAGFRITSAGVAEKVDHVKEVADALGEEIDVAEGRQEEKPEPPLPTRAKPVSPGLVNTNADFAARLHELTRHEDKRIAKAATKTVTAYEGLTVLVEEWQAKAQARLDVERLERELREAKAKLRGQSPTPARTLTSAPPAVDSKAVRAWATASGVLCPPVGRVPKHVLEAYAAAQEQVA